MLVHGHVYFLCSNIFFIFMSRMARYRLLDEHYDREHRARFIEDGEVRVLYLFLYVDVAILL